jgi:hypothetical protein
MKSILPPKHDYIITLTPQRTEWEFYRSECQAILNRIGQRQPLPKKSQNMDKEVQGILPELMSLRLLCSNGSSSMDINEESTNTIDNNNSGANTVSPEQADMFLNNSIKLKVSLSSRKQ